MSILDSAKKYLKVFVSVLVAASLLTVFFPSREGNALPAEVHSVNHGIIHIFAFEGSDAILVESNGEFAMIDSGEDDDYPSGKDDRYPLRSGIIKGNGKEDQVIQYMKEHGVTSDNLKVYIGTHAHSDHIGSADEIIDEFTPDYVYTPLYDDSYITDESKLWDNQYVYDKLIKAAKENDAILIQEPTEEERRITLGSLTLEIENYHEIDSDFRTSDANDYCWGIKVTDGVNTAFLAGDINNNTGSEDELSGTLGHIDALKMGHHGLSGSNTASYIKSLSPCIAIITGKENKLSDETSDALFSLKTNVITAADALAEKQETIRLTFSGTRIVTNISDKKSDIQYRERKSSPYMTAYRNYEPVVINGWKQVGKYWYWFENSSTALENTWKNIDGVWYYLQENARMATGWAQSAGKWYYMNGSGEMQTGWKKVKGEWYYLNSSGEMQTGWLKTGGKWYYLNSNGAMATGWKQVGKTWYYLNSSGAMLTGWQKISGKWYYLNSSGAMATGWKKLSGKWYYLDKSSGAMQTGWEKVSGKWYYLNSSGAMKTGWVKLSGKWYYLNSSGAMQTGWEQVGKTWYYMDSSGVMQTGWLKTGGKWYYLNSSGAMATGWKKVKGSWYYMNSSGAMQVTCWVGNYYVQSDGSMATNKWIDNYYVGSDGKWVDG